MKNNIKEIFDNKEIFDLFSKIFLKKINGATISIGSLSKKEEKLLNFEFFEIKYYVKCKKCKCELYLTKEYECECGNLLTYDLKDKYNFNNRIDIKKEIFQEFNNILFKEIVFKNKHFKLVDTFTELPEDMIQIKINKTNLDIDLNCLDTANLNKYNINWNFDRIKDFIYSNKIINYIFDDLVERYKLQISWGKIDENQFEQLCIDLIKTKNLRVIPKGEGSDQGKDSFVYDEKRNKYLLQSKFKKLKTKNRSFNSNDMLKYYKKSQRHNCVGFIFMTNGEISGDALTEVESSAYKDCKVILYPNNEMFNLLFENPKIKNQYFLRKK
jgi:Zn finger protein HypA/HybF involved in hydrogenase expression